MTNIGYVGTAPERRLRIDEVQGILKLKRRCVYYHARKHGWKRVRGLYEPEDVYHLAAYLAAYHNRSDYWQEMD